MSSVMVDYRELRDAELFKDMPEAALQELARACRYVELPAGVTLFQQGEPGDALYILIEGQIHIVRRYPNGDEVILATEGPYYTVGDISMLAGEPRTGGVRAVSDSTLIVLPRTAFEVVCEKVPGVAAAVEASLARRLYRLTLLVRENAIGNAAARVASVLLMLANGSDKRDIGPLKVSRIARGTALDADTVERILLGWESAGLVTYDGSYLRIVDKEALEIIAG